MRPVIGINCDYEEREGVHPRHFLNRDYSEAVELEGGIPVLFPFSQKDEGHIEGLLGMLNGLILSGGKDIDPVRYGQNAHPSIKPTMAEKEEFDFRLVEGALKMDMPILGICYGEQLINVSLGGSLVQDIPSQIGTSVDHSPSEGRHRVLIERGTRLHRLLGVDAVDTNSSHHQAIDQIGGGLRVCARAEDGVIEAVESVRHTFVLAVQWHPERMLDDTVERRLFSEFMKEVRAYASQRI